MTLLQFEPLLWKDVTDYPDLGCAMLMGAYWKNGIDAHLLCTQSVYIEELFLREAAQLRSIYRDASSQIRMEYADMGIEDPQFPDMCRNLYNRYYSRRWSDYFDAELTLSFKRAFTRLTSLQFDVLREGRKDVPLTEILCRHLEEVSPDIAAISFYEMDDNNQLLLRRLRTAFPDITFVIGGAFTAHLSNQDISLLRESCLADYLSIGPGEIALPALFRYVSSETELLPENVIPLHGEIPYNLDAKPIRNLNDMASPDFSESRVDRYPCPHTILPLQTARGCTWHKCTFCSHHRGYYGEYHTFQVARLVNDMKALEARFGCKWFILHDDDIPVNRLLLLGKALHEEDLEYRIYAYVRADVAFLKDNTAERLFQYGIHGLSFGIESGSQKVLDSIQKGIRTVEAHSILKATNRAGISNTCWMMVNLPGESDDDLQESIHFMTQASEYVDLWLVSPFRAQYDSPIYESSDHSGELTRPPFSCSVPPNELLLKREQRVSDMINRLFSAGMFENHSMPTDKIPVGAQRSRLIPFLLRDQLSLEACSRESFQLYANYRLVRLGRKNLLVDSRKKNIRLTDAEVALWDELLGSCCLTWARLTDEAKSFCEKILETGACTAYPCRDDYYAYQDVEPCCM